MKQENNKKKLNDEKHHKMKKEFFDRNMEKLHRKNER